MTFLRALLAVRVEQHADVRALPESVAKTGFLAAGVSFVLGLTINWMRAPKFFAASRATRSVRSVQPSTTMMMPASRERHPPEFVAALTAGFIRLIRRHDYEDALVGVGHEGVILRKSCRLQSIEEAVVSWVSTVVRLALRGASVPARPDRRRIMTQL